MIAFPVLNSLLIRGTEESINELIEILKFVDRKPQQIVIELQSVQVSTSVQKQLGVDWYYIAGNWKFEPQGMTTASNFIVNYNPPGEQPFELLLTYLLETGRGRVVDAIRVATMNLLPAVNSVTTDVPWVTVGGIAGDPFRGSNIQTLSVTTYSVTTYLSVTPRINGDGTITMYIPYQDSSITGSIQVPIEDGNIEYPITTTNNLVTTVNVRDGETFVLGGFINKDELETERKVPVLGYVPIIGDLFFTRQVRAVNETETLIFITPRIVKEEAMPATLGPI
jgi:general secretion pathway protein D